MLWSFLVVLHLSGRSEAACQFVPPLLSFHAPDRPTAAGALQSAWLADGAAQMQKLTVRLSVI